MKYIAALAAFLLSLLASCPALLFWDMFLKRKSTLPFELWMFFVVAVIFSVMSLGLLVASIAIALSKP